MNLTEVLQQDKVMYVLTGISGTGKSTVASLIASKYNVEVISIDDMKVEVRKQYEISVVDISYGSELHKLVNSTAKYNAKMRAVNCAMHGKNILMEYCFEKDEWQSFFDYISKQFGYILVIVNFNTEDAETVWIRRCTRNALPEHAWKNHGISNDIRRPSWFEEYSNDIYCKIEGSIVTNKVELLNALGVDLE